MGTTSAPEFNLGY